VDDWMKGCVGGRGLIHGWVSGWVGGWMAFGKMNKMTSNRKSPQKIISPQK
jgi:hypothetical protein